MKKVSPREAIRLNKDVNNDEGVWKFGDSKGRCISCHSSNYKSREFVKTHFIHPKVGKKLVLCDKCLLQGLKGLGYPDVSKAGKLKEANDSLFKELQEEKEKRKELEAKVNLLLDGEFPFLNEESKDD